MTDHPSRPSPSDADGNAPRYLVGIGASAGGLDACKRLIGSLHAPHDMAFVVIMHLDPHQKSHMRELLSAATQMEVVKLDEEQRILPQRVYVISPDTLITVKNGLLTPQSAPEPHFKTRPIDEFFNTLASTFENQAIGVVLSGTGLDGAEGLKGIKSHGGLCLAQDPFTAEYDGMPQAAIDTGVVDQVLSPEEIAEACQDFAAGRSVARAPSSHGDTAHREEEDPAAEDAFGEILKLLGRAYGVNFSSSYKLGTLERRIARRMGLKQINDWSRYLDLLGEDSSEVTALFQDLLIDVTRFFRDPDVWKVLDQVVIPEFLKHRQTGTPIKVWVPGCATGEEAYTWAMLLWEHLEPLGEANQLQIFATDVSEDAIVFARRGQYPSTTLDGVSPQRLSRFFRKQGDNYEVHRDLRERLTFAVHNLLSDPPFARLDFISCRNVLIYLQTHAQRKIIDLFHFALKPGALLLLGSSESPSHQDALFESVSKKSRLFRSVGPKRLRDYDLDWTYRQAPPKPLGHGTGPVRDTKVNRLVEKFVLGHHTQACVAVTESLEIQSFFGPTDKYLLQPTGEARMELLAWVKPGVYPHLRRALDKVKEDDAPVSVDDIHIERQGVSVRIGMTVEPIKPLPAGTRMFLVNFREDTSNAQPSSEPRPSEKNYSNLELESELKDTRQELRNTIDDLESTNEEYQASHEELLSLNEELQSNNEELESSKEELQSLNEELITVNQQVQEKNRELRELNTDLNNFLTSSSVPIVFLDRHYQVRRYTPAMTKLLHLVPSDIGRPISHIKRLFRDDSLIDHAQQVLENLAPVTATIEGDDGSLYARHILPYRTDEDRIDGVCIVFQDVTEQRRASAMAEEERKLSKAIVATIQTPLIVLDSGLRVVSVNRAFCDTFRVSAKDTTGALVYELGNRQWDIPQLRELLEKILPERGEIRDFEVDHDFTGLGRRIMQLNARSLRDSEKPMMLLAIDDVTKRREAEKILETRAHELEKEHYRKDEFLAMLGHELRNPLSALIQGLDVLEAIGSDPQRFSYICDTMSRQAHRMKAILDQLLDVARLTAGKIKITPVPVDLVDAVNSAVEATTPNAEAKGHDLQISLPTTDDKVFVFGDMARITQLVENLLSNAIKYTGNGGHIDLALTADRDSARLRIKDDGAGMDEDLLQNLFEPFTQAPRTLDRSEGGLGLGLPLVKRLAELHGGRIEAKSDGPGKGSEFTVTLPRTATPDVRPAEQQVSRPLPVTPRRILLVEDEEDAGHLLQSSLESRGHQTWLARDGEEALKAVREFDPEAVLLDLGLPKMDGYQVARRLRDAPGGRDLLLVALTGYQKNEDKLKEAGFDQHLLKPADLPSLEAWLADL